MVKRLIPTLLRPCKDAVKPCARASTRAVAQRGPPVERFQEGQKRQNLRGPVCGQPFPCLRPDGNDEKGNAMKRNSLPQYDNPVGCVLLWIAVIRPDRRTAMRWLRVAIRERNRKAQLQ